MLDFHHGPVGVGDKAHGVHHIEFICSGTLKVHGPAPVDPGIEVVAPLLDSLVHGGHVATKSVLIGLFYELLKFQGAALEGLQRGAVGTFAVDHLIQHQESLGA